MAASIKNSIRRKILLLTSLVACLEFCRSDKIESPKVSEPIFPPPLPVFYKFGYKVNSPKHGTEFSHSETKIGHVTRGQYRVKLPDGRIQVVYYSVDRNSGFVVLVTYE